MTRTVKAKTPRSSPLPSHRSRSRRASPGLALCHEVSGGVQLSLLGCAAAAFSASAAAPPRIPVFGSPVPFRAGSRSCFAAGFEVFTEGLAGACPAVFPTRLAAGRRFRRARGLARSLVPPASSARVCERDRRQLLDLRWERALDHHRGRDGAGTFLMPVPPVLAALGAARYAEGRPRSSSAAANRGREPDN